MTYAVCYHPPKFTENSCDIVDAEDPLDAVVVFWAWYGETEPDKQEILRLGQDYFTVVEVKPCLTK